MAENQRSTPSSKTEDTPMRAREEQEEEEIARHSHLHTLDKPDKIETLTTIDLFDLPALLCYRPDEAGSFKEIYYQHQAEIHTAILERRFLPEWRFIAGDDGKWDPLAPIPDAYHARIEMAACLEQLPARAEKLGETDQKYDLVWPCLGQKQDRLRRCNDVIGGGLIFLTFLQNMEDTISSMEREIMKAWRVRFNKTDAIKKTWILPWAERNLHRALLVLWSMNLPKPTLEEWDSLPPEYRRNYHRKLRHLTSDEAELVIQLSEATASWHLGRPDADIATEAPTKITQAGWMYRQWFLTGGGKNPFGGPEQIFLGREQGNADYNS